MLLKICDYCYSQEVQKWKGWPHKDPLPKTTSLFESSCPVCQNSKDFQYKNYYWENIHNGFSTGLPDYWLISNGNGNEYDRLRLQKHWGQPFLDLIECKKCGEVAFISEHMKDTKIYCVSNCK